MPLVASTERPSSERVLGLLSVGHSRPGAFTAEHFRVAQSLAISAAVAIQNARLYERAEIYAAELEALISKRGTGGAKAKGDASLPILQRSWAFLPVWYRHPAAEFNWRNAAPCPRKLGRDRPNRGAHQLSSVLLASPQLNLSAPCRVPGDSLCQARENGMRESLLNQLLLYLSARSGNASAKHLPS